MLVLHLRGLEDKGDSAGKAKKKTKKFCPTFLINVSKGKTIEYLVEFYLKHCESQGEEQLQVRRISLFFLLKKKKQQNDALVRLIIKRLVKKDKILVEDLENPELLKVHVNYVVS